MIVSLDHFEILLATGDPEIIAVHAQLGLTLIQMP